MCPESFFSRFVLVDNDTDPDPPVLGIRIPYGTMFLKLVGNLKCCARMKGKRPKGGKIRFVTALDLIKCSNRSNNRVWSFRAHLFLSYHLI